MWFDISIRYIKENRIASLSLAGISLVSATLLSLLFGVCYNLWIDRSIRMSLKGEEVTSGVTPLVVAFFFLVVVASASLITMVHHAFEITMNQRMHQLGIFKSVGATPRQIRAFLIRECLLLCILPISLGITLGIGLCYLYMQLMIVVTSTVRKYDVVFRYNILVFFATFVVTAITVWISAWIPARKISRLQPLEAIYYGKESTFQKMKRYIFVSKFFGVEGELARKSMYARKKILRTSTISLMISVLAFNSFLNLERISGLSTKHTYFERYKDKWDFMITSKDSKEKVSKLAKELRQMEEIGSCIQYQKTTTYVMLTNDMSCDHLQSVDMAWIQQNMSKDNSSARSEVPIYILDPLSFSKYSEKYQLDREASAILVSKDCSDRTPDLKEPFYQYDLSIIMPVHSYEEISTKYPIDEYLLNIKLQSEIHHGEVKEKISDIINVTKDSLVSRTEEEAADNSMRRALRIVVGVFAGLLACIGISNVFSATLGQVYQRKKEFARYLSVGLSPKGMNRILNMEVIFIALKPVLNSILINIPLVLLCLNIANIPIKEFLMNAPIIKVLAFASFIFITVWIAYHIGAKKICNRDDIIEILKDETLV